MAKGKKVVVGFLWLALLMGFVPVALAEAPAGHPAITPDMPVWGLKTAWEDFRLWIPGSQVEKAKYEVELQRERLAEASAMVAKNDPGAATLAIARYEEKSRDLEARVTTAKATPGFAEIKAMMNVSSSQRDFIIFRVPPQAQSKLISAREAEDRTIAEASKKSNEADKVIKEWLRGQEKMYNMDPGISLVAVYEGLINNGKAPEGQLDHAVRWYNSRYQLPRSLNGKVFSVTITKDGGRKDSGTVIGIRDTFWVGISDGKIAYYPTGVPGGILAGQLVVQSENIQTYIGHMMANDRLAMASDLREIGAGKDLIALAGLVG